MTTRFGQAIEEALRSDGLPDLGGERSRLFVRVIRHLAKGVPVTVDDIAAMAADLDLDADEARDFLEPRTEHDTRHDIVGFGLTLKRTPHRFSTARNDMFAWCALDTLILPHLLEETAHVESSAPGSGTVIRLVVGPDGISQVRPIDAVITLPDVDPQDLDTSTVNAIWATFCHRSYFFPSPADAERWASANDRVEVASPADGFAVARRLAAAFLASEVDSQ